MHPLIDAWDVIALPVGIRNVILFREGKIRENDLPNLSLYAQDSTYTSIKSIISASMSSPYSSSGASPFPSPWPPSLCCCCIPPRSFSFRNSRIFSSSIFSLCRSRSWMLQVLTPSWSLPLNGCDMVRRNFLALDTAMSVLRLVSPSSMAWLIHFGSCVRFFWNRRSASTMTP